VDLARRASRRPVARRLAVAALVVAAGCTSSGPAPTDDRAAAPATTVVGAARFLGVVGDQVLWGGPERHAGPFTLTDRRTGARHRLARPAPHGWAGLRPPCPRPTRRPPSVAASG
jgi:hypothetical protein